MNNSPKKEAHPNSPLHGITLKAILESLTDHYSWDELAAKVDINCFKNDPSIKSSLTFLRRTPWARTKVEQVYLNMIKGEDSNLTESTNKNSKYSNF